MPDTKTVQSPAIYVALNAMAYASSTGTAMPVSPANPMPAQPVYVPPAALAAGLPGFDARAFVMVEIEFRGVTGAITIKRGLINDA